MAAILKLCTLFEQIVMEMSLFGPETYKTTFHSCLYAIRVRRYDNISILASRSGRHLGFSHFAQDVWD